MGKKRSFHFIIQSKVKLNSIINSGVQIHFSTRVTPTSEKNQGVDGTADTNDNNTEITQASMILLASKSYGYLSSGSKKMYTSMKTVVSKTIDNFPGRLTQ